MPNRLLVLAAVVCAVGCAEYEPGWGTPRSPQTIPPGGRNSGAFKRRATELSGGTLAIASGGRFAAVSDSDNDRVWVVDLADNTIRGKIVLPDGSQPERIVEDGSGHLRVALRGTGQVATLSPSGLSVLETQDACAEVRGLTWSKRANALLVACAGGEMVTLKGSTRTVVQPAADLRDVMQVGEKTWVSTFRSAKLIELDATGKSVTELALPKVALPEVGGKPTAFVPAVAWRTIVTPDDRMVTIHQRTIDGDIAAIQVPTAPPARPYYQNICNSSIVRTTVSVVDQGAVTGSVDLAGVLPIDLAVSPDGLELAIAQPGSRQVQRLPLSAVNGVRGGICAPNYPDAAPVGQVTGVAFTPQNDLVVHTREPMAIWVLGKANGVRTQQQVLLNAATIESPGHALFHNATGAIACASCHPEGADDGHVWTLFKQTVRTQSLAGGVIETAPFHWSGTVPTIKALLDDTFVSRMGGVTPTAEVVTALSDWMEKIPRPQTAKGPEADLIAQGKALFNDVSVGCSTCHTGEALTNNSTLDVGTGGSFQVPSLRGVSLRGPWMHDGCAAQLKDRFGPCGGTKHGTTDKLTPNDVDALVSYLGTL
jgi:mono/diheme cytochrome c family protein